jgi:NAD(P)-dependent dehydrogenase (short-subunit alcohol dehydrogenase family)
MSQRFSGRSVIVTGAARGIGRAAAEAFLREGASVALVDVNGELVRRTAEEIGDPERVLPLACDITQSNEVEAMVGQAAERFGGVDVLVNNAGVCTLNLCIDMSEDEWDRVMDVNVKGMWLCTKFALHRMLPPAGRGGAVVNIASQAARRAQRFTCHYSASKMAVIGFTRAVAVEVAPAVRVNAVSPGTIGTDMIQNEVNWRIAHGFDRSREEVENGWLQRIPMGRYQQPEHIARAILFLASDEASETTGETLNVSGGAVME